MTSPESRPVSLAAVGRTTLLLTGSAVIVQVIGFARLLFLAAEVGIASGYDALLIALAAPLALVGILTAGLSTAMVPAYAEAKEEQGSQAARRLVGTVLVWTAIAGLLLSIALWVFAEPIVTVTGPGLAATGNEVDAVRWLQVLAPLGFLLAISSIFYALCQVEFLFPAMALASVLAPLLTLAITITFWDSLALDGLVLGTLVGEIVSLGILVVATLIGRVAPSPGLLPRGLRLRALLRHAVPLSASAAILEVNMVFDRAVASWLAPGGVSALRYGESIVRLPFAAILPAWSKALYPALVRADRALDQTALADMTERVLRYTLIFFVPLAWLTLAVAPLAVATAYDRGAFSGADLRLTAELVAVSAPLIVTWTVAPTLVVALNARRMGMVMMVASVVNVTINVVLNIVLGLLFGVIGVALATTLVSIVMVVYFSHRLARAEPTFHPRVLATTFVRASLAILPGAIAFGIPIWAGLVDGDLAQRIAILVVVGVAGLTWYYSIARRLGLQEASYIVAFGKGTLRRIAGRLLFRG